MKSFFLPFPFLLFLAFLSCSRNEEVQRFVRADREVDGLLGPVKSVEWITEEFMGSNSGEQWSEPTHWRTFEYNRQGHRIKDGYDDSMINHFDKYGRKTFTEYYDGTTFHFDYDKNGHRVGERYLDKDRNLKTQWNYKWIPALMADYLEVCNPDGSVKGRAYWYFDEKGNDVCRSSIDSSHGDILFDSFREYDADDNEICYEQRSIDQEGKLHLFVRRSRRTEEPVYVWRTNEVGISTNVFEYEYDERENWIFQRAFIQWKQIDPNWKKEQRRVHRKIEYYE